jgi:hypothetical protein
MTTDRQGTAVVLVVHSVPLTLFLWMAMLSCIDGLSITIAVKFLGTKFIYEKLSTIVAGA